MADHTADTTGQTHDTQNGDLGEHIERRLYETLHVHLVASSTADAVFLDGRVDTPELRTRVESVAREMAPGKRILNNVEVEQLMTATEAAPREEASDILDETNTNSRRDAQDATTLEQQNTGDVLAATSRPPDTMDELDDPTLQHVSSGMDASLTDQPLETNAIDVVDDTVYDADDPAEPDPAYFAPTDPIIGSDARGNLTVINGLEPTAMDSDTVDVSASDNRPGDEALADAIRRELREDATTTDLKVYVEVRGGIAHLRGSVPSVDDAENVEWVASEVPGVIDVDEQLDVQGL